MLKLFEMFSGYGGASFALKKAGIDFECVGTSEIDKYAMQGGDRQPFIIDDTQGFDIIRNYSDFCPCIRAQRSGLKVLNNFKIRKLTPKECFRLMGFLNDEINLEGISNTQQYKLAGNGWDINLVSKIFKQMFKLNREVKKIEEENKAEKQAENKMSAAEELTMLEKRKKILTEQAREDKAKANAEAKEERTQKAIQEKARKEFVNTTLGKRASDLKEIQKQIYSYNRLPKAQKLACNIRDNIKELCEEPVLEPSPKVETTEQA